MAHLSYYWSGFPFPSPEDLPDSGIEPGSPALYTDALPSEPPGKSYPYMTTGKTIDLTKWTFVDKGLSLLFNMLFRLVMDFPGGSDGKASVYNAGDLGSIPESGKFPGEGNGNPLQYSCLENFMAGGAS